MKITLTESKGYTIIPEGTQVLTIVSAKAVPSVRPQFIEIEFKHANGGTCRSKYDLSKDIGVTIFIILLRSVLINVTEFDTDNLYELEGKTIKADIVHTKVESTKEAGKMLTFVNIKKIMPNDTPLDTQVDTTVIEEEEI